MRLQITTMKLRKSKTPTNVRLDDATSQKLSEVAARFNLPAAELIRRAVSAKLSEWEKSGIVIRGN